MVPISQMDEHITEGLTKVKYFFDGVAESESAGPSCPALLLDTTSCLSSMRSWFRVRISPQPVSVCGGAAGVIFGVAFSL